MSKLSLGREVGEWQEECGREVKAKNGNKGVL